MQLVDGWIHVKREVSNRFCNMGKEGRGSASFPAIAPGRGAYQQALACLTKTAR